MFGDLEAPAPEFRQELRAVLPAGPEPSEIDMEAFHVAQFLCKPSGGTVRKPCAVQRFQPAEGVIRKELAPALVENGPQADARMIPQRPDRRVHRVQEVFPRGRIPVHPDVIPGPDSNCRQNRILEITVFAAVHHVLENDHAQAVAVVIELFRFDLDMLPQHIETERLHGPDIRFIAGRIGGRIQAVAPVALVQQAVKKIRFPVQAQARLAVDALNGKRPQRKIRFNPVPAGSNGEPVQVRVFRAPADRICYSDPGGSPDQGNPDAVQFDSPGIRALRGDFSVIPARMNGQGTDVLLRNWFNPYRLPDAGHRRVPHAAALFLLLSPGMPVGQVVGSRNGNLIHARADQFRDIRGKRKIAFLMGRSFLPVDPDSRFPADRTEMQQDPFSLPFLRQGEMPGIYHFTAVFHLQVYAGKQAFRAERNCDFRFFFPVGEFPFSVQAQPVLPGHLRTRIGIPWNAGQVFSGGCK